MRTYILHRLLGLLPVLAGITLLSFLLLQIPAADAADMLFERSGAADAAVLAQTRALLGLDQSLYWQYLNWLKNLLQGDAGLSLISRQPVNQLFWSRLPVTITLAVSALSLTILLTLPLGIFCALRASRLPDNLLRCLTFLGNGMPGFIVAFLLMYFFALRLRLLPVTGAHGWQGYVLPTLALTLPMTAKYTRHVRAELLRELAQPYVSAALLRGIPRRIILQKFLLRSSLPTLVNLTALSLGSLLGGTAIIESIFMLDGIGRLAVEAINMKDYPVLLAYVIWTAFIYTLINLLADIAQRLLDPRLEHGEAGKC